MTIERAIAANRFGIGARPDDLLPNDARRALLVQFERFEAHPAAFAGLPTRTAIARELADYVETVRSLRIDATRRNDPAAMKTEAKATRIAGREAYVAQVGARMNAALVAPAPFVERLVHFWANHFAISADKLTVTGMGGLLEIEAIRPHVLGRFEDMLVAVEQHPAMLLYLDQAQSVGPDSQAGRFVAARRQRKIGLNENLAREIMELHTLGVRTGYSQADVTELARALTGWTVAGVSRGPGQRLMRDAVPGSFVFVSQTHQPGVRTIMGQRFDQPGVAQARAVLAMLAAHAATATHVATKLARHFAGDTPPPRLVKQLADSFLQSGGDLPIMYRVLIEAPELWVSKPLKFKTPWEWSVSALRALGTRDVDAQPTASMLTQLGQPVWRPGSPSGFDDADASWAGPDALFRRVEAAGRFGAKASGSLDARTLGEAIMPGMLSAATAQAIARCESPAEGLALMLVSPEFLRR